MISTPEQFIHDVCYSNTLSEAVQKFNLYKPVLENYHFVISVPFGNIPGNARKKYFSNTAKIKTPFLSDQLIFIDRSSAFEMQLCDRATLRVDYSISLDSNTTSYLWPYINSDRIGAVDLVEVLEFISRDDVFVDPIPFFMENAPRLLDLSNSTQIFNRVKGYEILRNLDPALLKKGIIRTALTEDEIIAKTQSLISDFYVRLTQDDTLGTIIFRRDFKLCQILKMVSIQFGMPNKTIADKLSSFFEFCNNEMATFDWRAIAIAKEYFSKGQNFSFFGKIQKGRKGLFEALNGMAWDMLHVMQLEESITIKPEEKADYFLPALLTFDQGLSDMMDLHPLKAIAFSKDDKRPIPFYAKNPLEIISDDEKIHNDFHQRYYSLSARIKREKRRESFRDNIGQLKTSLLEEVERFSGVRSTIL
ncbi:hypothetical protein [Desulfovibrio fairfieldensis]|nr:hypothetical protein [Desulfovibrio fairfieldensis]